MVRDKRSRSDQSNYGPTLHRIFPQHEGMHGRSETLTVLIMMLQTLNRVPLSTLSGQPQSMRHSQEQPRLVCF